MVYQGTNSGNLWHQARILISAIFASVVAFLWVDAFREVRGWITYDMPDNVYKAGISAILSFIFASVGVILALIVIMILLHTDNSEVTTLSENLEITVTDITGTIDESRQFIFEHKGHIRMSVTGEITSSIHTPVTAYINANGTTLWTLNLEEDDYPTGGSFTFTRSVPEAITGESTIIEMLLVGEATNEVSISLSSKITVIAGEVC